MNNVLKLAIAAAVLSCTSAAMAQATAYYPSWYIMPSVNSLDADSIFGAGDRGAGLGLKFGKVLAPQWDMQMGFTYARARNNGARYQQDTLGIDALYMFSRSRFRPFVLAGLGLEYDKTNNVLGERSKTSPYLDAGLGFQYAFTDQWSMQADVRRVHGFQKGNTFNSKTSNNNYITVGLNYYFARPAHARSRRHSRRETRRCRRRAGSPERASGSTAVRRRQWCGPSSDTVTPNAQSPGS